MESTSVCECGRLARAYPHHWSTPTTLMVFIAIGFFPMTANPEKINFKPKFSVTNLIIKIQENKLPGSVIEDISTYVTDEEHDTLMFDIDSSGSQVCSIARLTGKLSLAISPDRELVSLYQFLVYASDDFEGGLNRQSSLTVFLYILDENDNNPVFLNTPYHKRINEDAPVGTVVIKIEATDKDAGRNADITFSFTAETSTDKFAIDARSGDVTVHAGLDFEEKRSHTMFVMAKDGGTPARYELTTLVVELIDVSDTPPYFVYHHFDRSVDENLKIGSSIAVVSAKDGDIAINNPIHYAIVGGDEYGLFAIDEKTGNVTVKGALDREYYTEFALQIKAYEYPQPSSFDIIELLVSLVDLNDNKPRFERASYNVTIKEDTQEKNIISDSIRAFDEDATFENNNIKYWIGEEAEGVFGVLQESGELVLLRSVSYRKKSRYDFVIYASETHTRERYTGSANVTVNINEVYDPSVARQKSSGTRLSDYQSCFLKLCVLTSLLMALSPSR